MFGAHHISLDPTKYDEKFCLSILFYFQIFKGVKPLKIKPILLCCKIINTFHRTDFAVFGSTGASLLVLSVSYERDEAECWANVANIVLRVQPGRLEQSVALSHRLDILSRRRVSHLPDSTRDRQSTRDIFSVITTSLGFTSRISLVQLSNFWNGDS